jgi:hypothetical protein
MKNQHFHLEFVEQGVVFEDDLEHYCSYAIYHAGFSQSVIIRFSSRLDHFSVVVLPGNLFFRQFKEQYLQLSADTFSANAFPSEEAAADFSRLLLEPEAA